MTAWDNILNTALLGTEKKQPDAGMLNGELATCWTTAAGQGMPDAEEAFLRMAALGYNYRRCGFEPLPMPEQEPATAPAEDKPYCTTGMMQLLDEVAETGAAPLLQFWLSQCAASNYVVPPERVIQLFKAAVGNIALRPFVSVCCGNRGAWLASMNPEWDFAKKVPSDDHWLTGTTAERKAAFMAMRAQDAGLAFEQLKQVWPTENANGRADLLRLLEVNLNNSELEWLETLITEKSQKVKDEAIRLLKMLPGSAILEQYWQIVSVAVQLKKEKVLLGLSSRQVLFIGNPVVTDETVFKTGIERLSKTSHLSDNDYILIQLISEVPPSKWLAHFNADMETIIGYFEKDEKNRKFLLAIAAAVAKFRDTSWAIQLAEHSQLFTDVILNILPAKEKQQYILKHVTDGRELLEQAVRLNEEWIAPFAKKILDYVTDNIEDYMKGVNKINYAYAAHTSNFFKVRILQIPLSTLASLRPPPAEEKDGIKIVTALDIWNATDGCLAELLKIKQNILNTFK